MCTYVLWVLIIETIPAAYYLDKFNGTWHVSATLPLCLCPQAIKYLELKLPLLAGKPKVRLPIA